MTASCEDTVPASGSVPELPATQLRLVTQPRLVIDTNVVLDLFVYQDPKAQALLQQLRTSALNWIAAPLMRDELARVLEYPHIAMRLARNGQVAADVLQQFDQLTQLKPRAPKAAFTCKDPDDQQFIDLALAWQAALISKDHAVLRMARRLATLGVRVGSDWATLSGENCTR